MSTITIFTIICVLFCLVAIAAVCLPLVKGRPNAVAEEDERHAQVLAILRQQKEELERDKAEGRVDIDEYEETKSEIERRVIEETREHAGSFNGPTVWTKILAVVLAVAIPASAVFGYLAWGRYTSMDPEFIRLMEQQQVHQRTGHSAAELTQSVKLLEEQVKKSPDDPNAWFLLARTYGSIGRFNDSVDAYRQVDRIVPNNANVLADMADVMAAANGKVITPDVVAVLEKSLRIDPNQWKALLLLALNAWDKQNYADAAQYWERVLRVTPPDFPDRKQIEENIREAKRLGGIADKQADGKGVDGTVPAPATAAPATVSPAAGASSMKSAPVPTTQAVGPREIKGVVSIDPALASKVRPDDSVFIYARPVKGSKMPVAFLKVKASELPYEFTLTGKTTMAAGMSSLADVDKVIVGARLSLTGNFMPQEGDIEGENPEAVKVGAEGVKVVLSHER